MHDRGGRPIAGRGVDDVLRWMLALRFAAVLATVAAILFGSAGRFDLPFFWAYLGLIAGFVLLSLWTLDRVLLEERYASRPEGRDNLALLRVVALVVSLAQWIWAGVDVGRLHACDTVPPVVQRAALLAFALCLGTWYWAMRANPFFSAAVRVQTERGHRVADTGPYRFVRHPGYAAFALLGAGGPLALGSWCAALPHLAFAALFIRRAAIEDRMLREDLPGYAAYADRVRYRLVPGIW
jgi:protein-S-isoprenylcysteine O-methyltransferase Ste14